MYKFAINAALAAAVGLGSMSFAPITANAQGLEIEIDRDGPKLRLRDDDRCDPRREDCDEYGNDGYAREDRRDRRRESRRICTEDRALDKADRMGIRRARVTSAGRRVVEVRGRDRRGDRVEIRFGRAGNCPIIG